MKILLLVFWLLIITPLYAQAETIEEPTGWGRVFEWQMNNVQFLYGRDYKFPPANENHEIITLEHADGWKYGDNYFFMDITSPSTYPKTEVYFELAPRLSFSKLTGKTIALGPLKDVLLAGQWNHGYNFDTHFDPKILLYGVGVDLQLPLFTFVQVNAYARDNQDTDHTSWQLSTSWHMPIEFGAVKIEFSGYFDWAGGDDDGLKTNLLMVPQLLLDIGNFFDKPGKLMFGTEYQYWKNKFGVDGVDEEVWQIMAKYYF